MDDQTPAPEWYTTSTIVFVEYYATTIFIKEQ